MNATKEITENDGEGMILRKVGSLYERGRSISLIKFKVYQAIYLISSSYYLFFIWL